MTKSEGVRLISELEAAEKLLALGWTKHRCAECFGRGFFVHDVLGTLDLPGQARQYLCSVCDGQGWIWQEPPK